MRGAFEIAFPTVEDVPALATLHVRCWQQAYRGIFPDQVLNTLSISKRMEGWTRTLADPDVYSPAAKLGENWVGFLHCGPTRQAHGDSEVYGIYVDERVYRLGLGRHLMNMAFENLRHRGFKHMVLCCVTENTRARRFYETMGGKVVDDSVRFTLEGVEYPEVMYGFTLV